MVGDVSLRLGYKFPLKTQQIIDMYDMCRYDQAWHLERPSPWCAVSIFSFSFYLNCIKTNLGNSSLSNTFKLIFVCRLGIHTKSNRRY